MTLISDQAPIAADAMNLHYQIYDIVLNFTKISKSRHDINNPPTMEEAL